ncbi:MAG: toll/interleukin-1 receptor domain-containing protein [Planctomycetes bacterium]|nr:toll/interleukin-1 receptor domain-containing protein [Planctomycetota bacterium]
MRTSIAALALIRRERDGQSLYLAQWHPRWQEVGVEVWLDAFDLPGGRNVKERIKEGMRSSTECLILLSPASRESDWVKHEAGLADGYGKPTVLVLLHVSDDDVPDPLRDLKFLSINEFPGYVRHLAAFARKK